MASLSMGLLLARLGQYACGRATSTATERPSSHEKRIGHFTQAPCWFTGCVSVYIEQNERDYNSSAEPKHTVSVKSLCMDLWPCLESPAFGCVVQ